MNTLVTLPLIVSLLVVVRKLWSIFGRYWTSPLRHLPGPKSPNFFYGYFNEMSHVDGIELLESWVSTYGKTFKYHEMANVGFFRRLL